MKKINSFIFCLILVLSLNIQGGSSTSMEVLSKKEILESLKLAQLWLDSQMVPNSVVKEPVRKNFILSYEQDPKASSYKYIFSKSSIYDNALAAIAFTMVGNERRARDILLAVKETSKDGSFYFNYNTHNSWPDENDRYGALTRNGASAWMGYAYAYFLKIKSQKDKNYPEKPEYKDFKKFLDKIISKILLFKIRKKEDPRIGFIKGGHGQYRLELKGEGSDVKEVFYDKGIEWVSVEHCLDFYFLLKEAVSLGLNHYQRELDFYRTKLVENFWNPKTKQFNRGLRRDQRDEAEALDAASWGAIYLYSVGEIEKSLQALSKTTSYLYDDNKSIVGHRPYLNMIVFEGREINKFFFPSNGDKTWNELPFIWYEGTFGVLLADLKIKGQTVENKMLLKRLIEAQGKDGSFIYANKEIPFQFSNRPSVASTAWFIIAASSYLVPKIRQSFWP